MCAGPIMLVCRGVLETLQCSAAGLQTGNPVSVSRITSPKENESTSSTACPLDAQVVDVQPPSMSFFMFFWTPRD